MIEIKEPTKMENKNMKSADEILMSRKNAQGNHIQEYISKDGFIWKMILSAMQEHVNQFKQQSPVVSEEYKNAMKFITDEAENLLNHCFDLDFIDPKDESIDGVTEIRYAINHCRKLLSLPVDKEGKWISVEDRLPEKECRLLGYSESYHSVETVVFKDHDFWIINDEDELESYEFTDAITHWMPLPSPPITKEG